METSSPVSSHRPSGTGPASVPQDVDHGATIDAWRERGADRFDPVRFRFIEVLARRAAAHRGDARRILDDKLVKLLGSYGEDLERARCTQDGADGKDGSHIAASPAAGTPDGAQHRGALGELVDHVDRHAALHEERPAASGVVPSLSSTPELKTLRHFRKTWSRLSADQRLTQSLEKVPDNAGPLNSHHLIHRSLTLMRDLSPEYLNRFMSFVDTLLWLDQLHGGGALAGKDIPRAERHGKAARGRSGLTGVHRD